ncbi:MAG: DUF1127 domain-containing protein [Rhodobacteraceae bacterium]|nr:DUF1127 domain-containing protein [Paracoccaceae bacterium]MCY4138585.1 DUF1127 domain-containing protein [Paracoccaceae bacterium]
MMAVTPETRTVPIGARSIYVLTSLFETATASIGRWYAKRQTRETLSRLSDRELDDIGLTRSEIPHLPDRF